MPNELKFKGFGGVQSPQDGPYTSYIWDMSGVGDVGSGKVVFFPTDTRAPNTTIMTLVDLDEPDKILHELPYQAVTASEPSWVPQGSTQIPEYNFETLAVTGTAYIGDGRCAVLFTAPGGFWAQIVIVKLTTNGLVVGKPFVLVNPDESESSVRDQFGVGVWGWNGIDLPDGPKDPDGRSLRQVILHHATAVTLHPYENGLAVHAGGDHATLEPGAFREFSVRGLELAPRNGSWRWFELPPDMPGTVGRAQTTAQAKGYLHVFRAYTPPDGGLSVLMTRCNMSTLKTTVSIVDEPVIDPSDDMFGLDGYSIAPANFTRDGGVVVGGIKVLDGVASGTYDLRQLWGARPDRYMDRDNRGQPYLRDERLTTNGYYFYRESSLLGGPSEGSAAMATYFQYGGGGDPYFPPGENHPSGLAIYCQLGKQDGFGELLVTPDRSGNGLTSILFSGISQTLVTKTHVVGFSHMEIISEWDDPEESLGYPKDTILFFSFARPGRVNDLGAGASTKKGYFA